MIALARWAAIVAAATTVLLMACVTPPPPTDPNALAEYRANDDPFEPANRKLFAVGTFIDEPVTAPVARGYQDHVPGAIRRHLANFSENFANPGRLVNDVLQGEPRRAGDTFRRLVINTTVGMAGIFDVATGWGYHQHRTDFSQTLALWGVVPGPYLFIPVVGPSDVRSLTNYPAGYLFSPFIGARLPPSVRAIDLVPTLTGAVDERAATLGTTETIRRTALDPYATFRSLYQQHQAAAIEAIREDNRATVPDWFTDRQR